MSRRRRRTSHAEVVTTTMPEPTPGVVVIHAPLPATAAPVFLSELRKALRSPPPEIPTPDPIPLAKTPEPQTPVAPWPDLSAMTVVQLRDRARELGVSLGKARTKAAIIEALGG